MKHTLQIFLHYSRAHWKLHALVFASYTLALILSSTIRPLYYRDIIDTMGRGTSAEIITQTFVLFATLIAITLTYTLLYRVGDYAISYAQTYTLRQIASDLFARLHRHDIGFFHDHFAGALTTKTRRFVRAYEDIYDSFTWNIWFALVTSVSIAISLAFIHVLFVAAFVAWIAIYLWITVVFIRWKKPRDLAAAEADSHVTGLLADTFTNALTIKMFAATKPETALYQSAVRDEYQKGLSAWNMGNHQNFVQSILLILVLEIGMMYIAISMWSHGTITVGTVALIQSYMLIIFDRMWVVGKGLTRIAESFHNAQEMTDILQMPIAVQDPPHPDMCMIQRGAITFRDVSYGYDPERPIFRNLSLQINSGEKIALVGHSGAGKSTITKLLLRFMDPSSGAVCIDGQDISSIAQDDLRSQISYVPQEPLLFHRTLRENILYSRPDASEEELFRAARDARIHDFIMSLPEGYDTLVGERGVKLSGGERQRVAIARAILKDAPILILDEATSSLDSISERQIQEALTSLMRGRTTIVIAHRLSTIQKMDRILVIENGSVAESGSHRSLLERGGIYADLWNEQVGGFIE